MNMEIRIRETGQVVSENEFRAMHPNTSGPIAALMEQYDADPVLEAPAPAVAWNQSALRDGVVQDNLGNWVYAWRVEDWSQEQIDAHVANAKAQKWEAIKAERDRRKAAGVKVGEKWFHSDDSSRIQQIGLVMMGASIPPGLQWKTMDGSFVAMTQALAGQIFQSVAAQDQAIFAQAEQHKAAMEAVENPATYDITTGWPAVYSE
jgi:hypothetical protein